MKLIFFMGNDIKEIEIDQNGEQTILNIAAKIGVFIDGNCAGNGTCGKCKVLITKGNDGQPDQYEKNILTDEELKKGYRLACRHIPTQDTCVIVKRNTDDLLINSIHRSGVACKEEKRVIDGTSYQENFQKNDLMSNGLYQNQNYRLYPERKQNLGLAIDIGTTTIEGALYYLDKKEKAADGSIFNPQRAFGGDIVSRISYSIGNKEHFEEMTKLVKDGCNRMIERISTDVCHQKELKKVVVVGNSAMSQFFTGIEIMNLSKTPFDPELKEGLELSGCESGLAMNQEGKVFVMPNIGGFVGSDTLGCILTADLERKKGIHLIVDIGTNGEMVISDNGNMVCCSTAAGPAFEGGVIHHGMRAEPGAITDFKIEDGKKIVQSIGEERPIGICGSGLINILSELLRNHIIDETGRIEQGYEILEPEQRYVVIYEDLEGKIILTQKDIREVQLAKAAISAGIQTLLENRNLSAKKVERFYLAGAFGNHINIENAIKIGLIPNIPIDKIEYIGNGALIGASHVLLGEVSKEKIKKLARNVSHLELGTSQQFRESYINEINFKS